MYVKRVRRKCSVRACRRTDSFALSKSREFGNSIIVCRDCLEAALKAIAGMNPAAGTNAPKRELKAPPPLFFNAEALGLTGAGEAEASGGADESAGSNEAEADSDKAETDKGASAEAEANTDTGETEVPAAEADGTGEAEVSGAGADTDTDGTEASGTGESAKANDTGKGAASEAVKAGGSGEHTCSYCGKKYASSAALKRHESKCEKRGGRMHEEE